MSKEATTTKNIAGWSFDNSYLLLPTSFYVRQKPVPVPEPRLVVFNNTLAQSLGLNSQFLAESDAANHFAGNQLPEGSEPIAQAYAGHQFGHFTMLGDGRTILLGEQIMPDGKRFDIQLKGAGQTPYSRAGDGRAALGPMLREYIISEAMHALGIPTTRSLAVVTTGQPVIRESILPGAILTRVAASHIRVGTFEYAAARGNAEELKSLADYTLQRHYPELLEDENPYLALLHAAMERQAALVAQWQLFGFIHGVMNTDNMTLSGETIDYGPCAFMDTYDPATVFSSIDYHGRYAYGNQPKIAQWNVARLTEALLPLLHSKQDKSLEMGQAALATFPGIFKKYWLAGMREKLGLFTQEADDILLIESLLVWMHKNQADFTNTFHSIASDTLTEPPCFQREGFKDWYDRWQARLLRQSNSIDAVKQLMRTKNPSVIPRNHQVEEALKAAVEQDNFSKMHKLLDVLARPYADLPRQADYQHPPEHSDKEYKTFCGT